MITNSRITEIFNNSVEGTDIYLVDLSISADNKITVYIDNSTKITIEDCARISRLIESTLDREVEDFELSVSSPGLDSPFKHLRQYEKRLGKQVAVVTTKGEKIIGKLENVNDSGIVIEQKSKEKLEGKKGKHEVVNTFNLMFNEIKETKLVLSF